MKQANYDGSHSQSGVPRDKAAILITQFLISVFCYRLLKMVAFFSKLDLFFLNYMLRHVVLQLCLNTERCEMSKVCAIKSPRFRDAEVPSAPLLSLLCLFCSTHIKNAHNDTTKNFLVNFCGHYLVLSRPARG